MRWKGALVAAVVALVWPTAGGAQEPPSGAPAPVRHTATVAPDTGLVDGQEVLITGDGFHPDAPGVGNTAYLTLCRAPVDGPNDCDAFSRTGVDVDVSGHVEAPYTVAAILELPDGSTHDCRTGGCELSVQDLADSFAEAALVPLAFDPSGPLLPLPTLDAAPRAGLVDGDLIDVTGTGWEPQSFATLLFCRAGPADVEDCGNVDLYTAYVLGAGEIDEVVTARTILRTGGGDRVDCRIDACSLVATTNPELRRAVEVPLAFDPDGELLRMTITVTPDHGLEDGDPVHVEGRGGRPGAFQVAFQCVAGATTYQQCHLGSLGGLLADGRRDRPMGEAFAGDVRVRRVLHLGDASVDCAVQRCVLAVSEDEVHLAARAALDFTPGGPGGPVGGPIAGAPPFTG